MGVSVSDLWRLSKPSRGEDASIESTDRPLAGRGARDEYAFLESATHWGPLEHCNLGVRSPA